MISAYREEEAQIFHISATAGDPKEAMKVANAVADAYVEFNYDRTLSSYRGRSAG